MTVVFVGAGSQTDSGGAAVSSITVPRPGGVAEGDLILILGSTEGDTGPSDDWNLDVGRPPWTKLASAYLGANPMQVWGKFLPAGPAADTTVEFDDPQIVLNMIQVVYRGVYSWKAAGSRSLTAPSVTPQGAGRAVRLYIAATQNPIGLTRAGGQTFRASSGSSSRFPFLISDAPCSTSPTGTAPAVQSGSHGSWLPFSATVVIGLNRPPTAPALVSPADSTVLDPSVTQRFAWLFNDPDVGSSQSKADFVYSDDFGFTWHTLTTVSPNNYIDIPAGTFTVGGSYQWRIRTYDQFVEPGPPSPVRYFGAIIPPDAPAVTYPTSGGTVAATDHVDWSVSDQDGFRVLRVADAGDGSGDPDLATVYFDSGEVDDETSRSFPLTFDTNDRYEHIRVATFVTIPDGPDVWSDFADIRVLVSYTPPPTADLVVSVGDDGRTMGCDWTTPAPAEGSPAATSVRLDVSVDGGTSVLGDWPNSSGLPVNGAAVYPWPASGVEHCFRATAVADNGAAAVGEWISIRRLTVDEVV